MNEVEKMYRNAHVYPRVYGDITKETFENKVFNMTDMCNETFTAEKQISLIKWLGELDMLEIMRTTREDKAWIINTEYGMSGNVYKYSSRKLSFADTLANLINELWQDLTEEERKQIKEILE